MKPKLAFVIALSWALSCGHTGSAYREGQVFSRGGELAEVSLDQMKVTVGATEVTAWGLLEVPDGSRLSAAYAGADAQARAELLKLVRVRIADVMVDVESTDPRRRDAYEHTQEVAAGVIRHAGPARHGWQRVWHGDRVILRVWSCLRIPRAELARALQAPAARELGLSPEMLKELEVTAPRD